MTVKSNFSLEFDLNEIKTAKVQQLLIKNLKSLFQEKVSVANQLSENKSVKKKLYTTGLDHEQIWQQIDKEQRETLTICENFKSEIKDQISQIKNEKSESEDSEPEEKSEIDSKLELLKEIQAEENDEEFQFEEADENSENEYQGEDPFYDPKSMHQLLDKWDNNDNQDSDEADIDVFGNVDDLTDTPLYFKDFEKIQKVSKKSTKKSAEQKFYETALASGDSDSGEESGEDLNDIFGGKIDPAVKSARDKRKERLEKEVKLLEEQNLGEKPWQLTGETSKSLRPENSLLTEGLDFDSLTKAAPVITDDFTNELEDIIKSRIKDLLWDNVERKVRESNNPYDYKNKLLALSAEKSKQSLAEIYEQDYLVDGYKKFFK